MTRILSTLALVGLVACYDIDPDDTGYVPIDGSGGYAGLGAPGADWDNDGFDDSDELLVAPVSDYIGRFFVRGDAIVDINAWSHGMYAICVGSDGRGDFQYWEYTEPAEPANMWYIFYMATWLDRDVYACTFADADFRTALDLDPWDSATYDGWSVCLAATDYVEDGTPVLELVADSDVCGRRSGQLAQFLAEQRG